MSNYYTPKGLRSGGAALEGLLSIMREPWIEQAVCAQVDPDMWFAEKGHTSTTQAARSICHSCPVKTECLNYAIKNREPHGVWGGLTEGERRHLLPAIANCAHCEEEFEPPKPQNRYCSLTCSRRAHNQQNIEYNVRKREAA